ncbi:UNVERIFIED_CONTAM: hypothetical protein Slati_0962000 [Sesamum latifolium]|uniref:DDE Tnp4 domain-containing protein n=1 Tax=Sesamum latifolium TaxID=2727402 RepID=A0AAW2XQU4_9LAMI
MSLQHFHHVLIVVLRLGSLLLAKPVPVSADSSCARWKWFEGCLGALDGTYIDVRVPAEDRARYRTHKGSVFVNVLGVCDREMRFIYVLAGYEGSAADARVLRDVISRPNRLKIPQGNYYLVDSGYSNGEGFLLPYRGVSPAFYSIKVQNRIIMACCLLHNYIQQEMADDPIEQLLTGEGFGEEDSGEYLGIVDSNPIWNTWRDEMAKSM